MFSRRWIINYILIFLIILFTYIGNRFDVKTGFQSGPPPVTALKSADVETIAIKTAQAEITLSRQAGGWLVESPIRWPADNGNVERLLALSESKTESRLGADQIDLATLGLDLPKALMRFNDTTILFGDTNNIGERRYVKIADQVYLLPDIYLPFVSQGLLGVLERRLIPAEFELTRLELPGLAIERGADGGWQSDRQNIAATDLQQLIDNWRMLPATRIQAYKATGTPRQKVAARLADGSELEFYVLSIDPEIVIANPAIGMQYRFRSDYYYQLLALQN